MPLPSLIEVVPPPHAVHAQVAVPGSKSLTNRALILAALARNPVTLEGALWSEDTQVMVEALRRLGFLIDITRDPAEEGNRTITVQGQGGHIPNQGTPDAPLDLFVGNAGTAARFLAALVCLGHGSYRLDGVPRMRERPQAELFSALRKLGYRVDATHERLPASIHGTGSRPGSCSVSITASSQFASALLLSAKPGGWTIDIFGDNADESPYVAMTHALVRAFPSQGGRFEIEPDASSGSYFWAANALLQKRFGPDASVAVPRWPVSGWQIDQYFPQFLPLPQSISRQTDLGDSIMTAVVLAPVADHAVQFTDLGRLRLQECERVQALHAELSRCGAVIQEKGDTLTVKPGPLRPATVQTYNDHRMAMAFATLALYAPGMRIDHPACVAKTFPGFFVKLAAPPPGGLGVTILDAVSRTPLTESSLRPD